MAAKGWRIANRSPVGVLCLEPPPESGDVRSIVSRVVASGRAWVALARFQARDTVRICVTHGETSLDDVAELVNALVAAA
jgi:hypothetical protein